MWNKGDFEKEKERIRRDMKIGKRELRTIRRREERGRKEGKEGGTWE